MSIKPEISIIIPTFNASKTLADALESIICQSFTNFEILIMDGLSTDNTLEIAQSYQDERIRIFSEKDHGIYDAMNKGIKIAKGEWVYFLGADDKFYNNDVIEDVSIYFDKGEYDVIYGDVISKAFNGRYDGEFNISKFFYQNICHQSIFMKALIFKKIGLYNLKYKILADWDFNLKWFFSPKVSHIHINRIIADYSDTGISTTTRDELFQKDKTLNYLSYGNIHLPLRLRISLFKNELNKSLTGALDLGFMVKTIARFPLIFFNIRIHLGNKRNFISVF